MYFSFTCSNNNGKCINRVKLFLHCSKIVDKTNIKKIKNRRSLSKEAFFAKVFFYCYTFVFQTFYLFIVTLKFIEVFWNKIHSQENVLYIQV